MIPCCPENATGLFCRCGGGCNQGGGPCGCAVCTCSDRLTLLKRLTFLISPFYQCNPAGHKPILQLEQHYSNELLPALRCKVGGVEHTKQLVSSIMGSIWCTTGDTSSPNRGGVQGRPAC